LKGGSLSKKCYQDFEKGGRCPKSVTGFHHQFQRFFQRGLYCCRDFKIFTRSHSTWIFSSQNQGVRIFLKQFFYSMCFFSAFNYIGSFNILQSDFENWEYCFYMFHDRFIYVFISRLVLALCFVLHILNSFNLRFEQTASAVDIFSKSRVQMGKYLKKSCSY
jgi:hypothetical protein